MNRRYQPMVDAEPVRLHVKELCREGMGLTAIAAAAGVSYSNLYGLLHGNARRGTPPNSRMRAETARKVMAVRYRYSPLFVDSNRSRDHVKCLMASGMKWLRVAELAGVPTRTVQDLLFGDGKTGRRRLHVSVMTERRILAVTADLDNFRPRAPVDATITHRKMRALVANGWSLEKLAGKLGSHRKELHRVLNRKQIAAFRARQIRDLYEELWNQSPPLETRHDRQVYSMTLRLAEAKSYRKPMDWDDIDDPNEQPLEVDHTYVDEVAVQRVMDGIAPGSTLTRAEKQEAVRRLMARGSAVSAAAARVGMSVRYAREAMAA